MSYQRSACCHAEILPGVLKDFPTGGATWFINYQIETCDSCGKEVEETVDECEECGLIGCFGGCEQIELEVDADETEISRYSCY